jgi:Methyltransferase domain
MCILIIITICSLQLFMKSIPVDPFKQDKSIIQIDNQDSSRYFSGVSIQYMEASIEKANQFHRQGGNLVAIQKYLDNYIDSSYADIGLKFIPTIGSAQTKPVQWLKEFLLNDSIPQDGYNRNLPGNFEGDNIHLLGGRDALGGNKVARGKRVVNVQEPFTEERFIVGMGPMGPNCTELSTLAEKSLCQGWDNKESECNIFSIGGNNEWSFELSVIEKAPHCTVHTFDCTLRTLKQRKEIRGHRTFFLVQKPKDDRIKFYPYCIGSESKHDFRTYSDLLKISNSKSAPRILKMDIEGFEYSVIHNILSQTPQDMWPEQIAMEIHWASRMVHLSWMFRALQASEVSLFFSFLFSRGGYLPVVRKLFPAVSKRVVGCASCMEVLLVRVLCKHS